MVDWDEIGKGDKDCQNPPPLNKGDQFVWNWFHANFNEFSVNFNLMPMLIDKLNLESPAQEIFLMKMDLIWKTKMRISEKEKEEQNAQK